MSGELSTKTQGKENLKPIDIRALRVGSHLEFPLYVLGRGDRRFKLLQGPNHSFSQNVFNRIQNDYEGTAYIYPEHVEPFEEAAKSSLNATFADPLKKPEEKVDALMHHADNKLQDALDDPDPYELPDFQQVSDFPEYVRTLLEGENDTNSLVLGVMGKNESLSTHSLQVCMYCMMIVNELSHIQFTDKDKEEIAVGFISYDIGKVHIDKGILNKPCKPNSMEWRIIRQIPERSVSILTEWGITGDRAIEIVRNHREHYDGNGYPSQLSGDDIPILARICSIADDFSSLTTRKAYRPALSPYDALWIMRVDNEGYYDTDLLSLFVDILVG